MTKEVAEFRKEKCGSPFYKDFKAEFEDRLINHIPMELSYKERCEKYGERKSKTSDL